MQCVQAVCSVIISWITIELSVGSVYTKRQWSIGDDASDYDPNKLQCFRSVRLHQASTVFNENGS